MLACLPGAPDTVPGTAVASEADAEQAGAALVIGRRDGVLALWRPGGRETPLSVDFGSGQLGYRLAADRVRHERLVKAVGLPQPDQVLIDATGGLGRDASLLAMAGWPLVLIERNPVLHALLSDGLARAPAALAGQIRLLCADSATWLAQPSSEERVVYLDPMFPARDKSAAVKKELAWLQWLMPPAGEEEGATLLAAARSQARKVVVKRPLRAPDLGAALPTHRVTGKTVRFDVYHQPRR